jgi:hypothetical protein
VKHRKCDIFFFSASTIFISNYFDLQSVSLSTLCAENGCQDLEGVSVSVLYAR